MASADISTSSSHLSSAASEEAVKRSVDAGFLNNMKSLVERLRLENATLKKSLDLERSEVRAMKAQHEATLRQLRTESRKKEEALEKQLRSLPKPYKQTDPPPAIAGLGVKKLCREIHSLKAANKNLQEKLKVAAETERERVAAQRAQEAQQASRDLALHKDVRAQVHKLLEEIKSKDRMIAQLKKASQQLPQDIKQVQKMESGSTELRRLRLDQGKEKSEREDLNTDIRHRKEAFYRERSECGDSAVSSAPTSMSPQPQPLALPDMWLQICTQCRATSERAETSARECARLTDALRDARDQLELLEFRLLELEDAAPDKNLRENLTDSDSGCVSPGSRLKDSASPELRRMDSGYKSPHTSPAPTRRSLATPPAHRIHVADPMETSTYSESGDTLKNSAVRQQLERMVTTAACAEDRICLEQVLALLYSLHTLTSSSDDDAYQAKLKRLCDIKSLSKSDGDVSPVKSHKVIATVNPYSQSHRSFTSESLESLCEVPKKISILQESGIFDDVETENKTTQTEGCDSLECGDLNTEIQRLNSIREKLEKRGVARSRPLSNLQGEEGLECQCVKLGKKHKQYYERRLKFLEGKISIYEAAQDVKKAKLAERLQNEFILENRIQDLETQLSTLKDKYEQLEEECCELEEIENDTRLHCQQLETDYELTTAQLRDMSEQRECSRAQAERLASALREREATLNARAVDLTKRLNQLEQAVPALIAWNVVTALASQPNTALDKSQSARKADLIRTKRAAIAKIRKESRPRGYGPCRALVAWRNIKKHDCSGANLQKKLNQLTCERSALEIETQKQKAAMERQMQGLKTQLKEEGVKMQLQRNNLETQIKDLKRQLDCKKGETQCYPEPPPNESTAKKLHSLSLSEQALSEKEIELEVREAFYLEMLNQPPPNESTAKKLHSLILSEQVLSEKVRELEAREAGYLEMLNQADDMWAEMEGNYKQKIHDCSQKVMHLESDRDKLRSSFKPLKKKVQDLEECETALRVSLEKAERDKKHDCTRLREQERKVASLQSENAAQQAAFERLSKQYKKERDEFRTKTSELAEQVRVEREQGALAEKRFDADLEKTRKDLSRSCKNIMELEVTNSELREEVESLESQLALMQKTVAQCKRKCDEKIKLISHELSIKTEELEELRSEMMRRSLRPSVQEELRADKTEYVDDGRHSLSRNFDFGSRLHHSLNYISGETRCSCPAMRSQLVGSLIEDLFERIHNTPDRDLTSLCAELTLTPMSVDQIKAKIADYLLMAISKELVRSIGDADAKTDTEEWERAVSSMPPHDALSAAGNAGVLQGAARLASVACACAAARLCASVPDLADTVKSCQEEVLEHSDVKIMEEQLASAIENIVNCPSCALGTNAIVWSTDV